MKVTVPVGIPASRATATIAAENVTAWPTAEGLAEDETFAVVFAGLTSLLNAADVLALKLASPP